MIRIAVLTGGSTPERDVALAGAARVVGALRGIGHSVTVIDTTSGELSPADEARLLVPSVGRAPPTAATLATLAGKELGPRLVDLPTVRAADVIFPILHGPPGEGGALQALLELAGLSYAGSGPLGSALAMDKDIAKRSFRDGDIPTAAWTMWPANEAAVRPLGFRDRGTALVREAIARNPHHLPLGYHALWADHLRRGEDEKAYQAALHYPDAGFFWRAMMRACSLGQLGRVEEAQREVAELLRVRPDFALRGRQLVAHLIKQPELQAHVADGLAKAGLELH